MAKIKSILNVLGRKALRKLFPGNNPDFMIIGAQKAGTSSLHSYLMQHPQLRGSNPKEIHYFDRRIYHGYKLSWYRKHFINLGWTSKLFFESTPNYIYQKEAPAVISEKFPRVKLILILRDPVKRAFSAWNFYRSFFDASNIEDLKKEPRPGVENPIYKYFFKNRNDFPDLMECINIEQRLIAEKSYLEPAILRRGIYIEQIKHYLKYFKKEDILILGFKDLVANSQETIDKCCDFLGIDKINTASLDLKPRNTKSYDRKITDSEEEFLNKFYKDFNKELFDFLGYKPNW